MPFLFTRLRFGGHIRSLAGKQARLTPWSGVLHVQAQALQLSLARKLLVVYADHEMWDEYVHCYLRLLRERPVHVGYFAFVPFALERSEQSGRAYELADALRHIVRFHPETESSNYLKASPAE